MVEPHSLNFGVLTVKLVGVRKLRNFTVSRMSKEKKSKLEICIGELIITSLLVVLLSHWYYMWVYGKLGPPTQVVHNTLKIDITKTTFNIQNHLYI